LIDKSLLQRSETAVAAIAAVSDARHDARLRDARTRR
jgi:hypothetical protein